MLNPEYCKEETQHAIKKAFLQHPLLPSVQLQQFFSEEAYQNIREEIQDAVFVKARDPLHCSYSHAEAPETVKKILHSAEFQALCEAIFGAKTFFKTELIRLTWKDYTILHDDKIPFAGSEIIIDCTEDWPEHAGGACIYVDGSGEYVPMQPSSNTVALVQAAGVRRFIQYCNHYADNKYRYLIIARSINIE